MRRRRKIERKKEKSKIQGRKIRELEGEGRQRMRRIRKIERKKEKREKQGR